MKSFKRELYGAGLNAAYDGHAKRLLAQKIVLAHILVNAVSEFAGMEPEEVVFLIENEPEVSAVPVNPGEARKESENRKESGSRMPAIGGRNTESQIPYEGKITYDIHFFAWAPGKEEKLKIILDVEAQKNFYPGYHIVSRGIFYTSRMLSAQLDTEFEIPNYDEIKKVYSIWICLNSPERVGSTITEFSMNRKDLVGTSGDLGRYDLLSVIIIGLPKELAKKTEGTELHRFLGTIFSSRLSAEEKKKILSSEYKIPMESELERRIHIMCNLSEAIAEEGMEEGIKKGMEKGIEKGMEKGIEEGIETGRGQLIANFLRNDNHVSHAVKLLGVSESLVLSVAQREGIKIIQ